MLADVFVQLYHGIYTLFVEQPLGLLSKPFLILALLGVLLMLWRLWAFTLSPLLDIEKPEEAPYWIPFIGHSLAIFRNSDKVIESGLNAFGRTRVPFSIRVWKERIYVITAPEDTSLAYKSSAAISWDEYLHRLLLCFGLSEKALELSWHKPQPGETSYDKPNPLNPQKKCLIHLTEDIYKMQLLPGEQLDKLTQKFVQRMEKALVWEKMNDSYVLELGATYKRLSLKLFCRIMMTETISRAMLGDLMFKYEPAVVEHLMALNDYSWALIFGYPTILTPKLNVARARLSKAIRAYVRTPEKEREGGCWSIKAILNSHETFGIDEDSRVAMVLMIWWAAHSNTVNASFWLLSYLIFNKPLLEAIRKETAPAFRTGTMDVRYLQEDCPLLDSTWSEVLRLVNGAVSFRKVAAKANIGGKTLQPGNSVIIPYRQLHFNEDVWGDSRLQFDPERFLKDPKLRSHPSYRPFGGGVSFCPGRHLAKSEVCGFAAMFLQRFDIDLPTTPTGAKQPFPRLDETKPSTGITSCMDDMDVFISINPRWAT